MGDTLSEEGVGCGAAYRGSIPFSSCSFDLVR